MSREPLFGMSFEQENRFFALNDKLHKFGYFISSEPYEGNINGWLDGIEDSIPAIEAKLADVNAAFRTRGKSKTARYYLTTSPRFDPGFGISLSSDQRHENRAYDAIIQRRRVLLNEYVKAVTGRALS